jgi:hypothetical protein
MQDQVRVSDLYILVLKILVHPLLLDMETKCPAISVSVAS